MHSRRIHTCILR